MGKLFITSGCSFTSRWPGFQSWPQYTFQQITECGYDKLNNVALASTGNGLIQNVTSNAATIYVNANTQYHISLKKILVLGSEGQIGKHLCYFLKKKNYTVFLM